MLVIPRTSDGDIHLLIISEKQCKFLVIDKTVNYHSRVTTPSWQTSSWSSMIWNGVSQRSFRSGPCVSLPTSVSAFDHLARLILSSSKTHQTYQTQIFEVTTLFYRKKIKLDVRKDHTGQWQVFDIVRKRFLPTVSPREGFERFLTWLESISQGASVYMVSHGNADILILDRSGLTLISHK